MDTIQSMGAILRLISTDFVSSREDIEDCMQEGRIAVWQAMQRPVANLSYCTQAARFRIASYSRGERHWRERVVLSEHINTYSDLRQHGCDFAPALIDALEDRHKVETKSATVALTGREADVLDRICSGMERKDIATDLGVSINAVKIYVTALYKKLEVKNSIQAYNEAMRRGMVLPPKRSE